MQVLPLMSPLFRLTSLPPNQCKKPADFLASFHLWVWTPFHSLL